jgi:hypothetical protein
MASATRPHIRMIRSRKPAGRPSRESALKTIVAILEDQMTDMGLNEEEKNAKVALFASLVDGDLTGKETLHATLSSQHHTVGNPV